MQGSLGAASPAGGPTPQPIPMVPSERETPVRALGPQRGGSEDSQRDPPGRARPLARRRPQSPVLASKSSYLSRPRSAQRAVLGEALARIIPGPRC
ncbi:hypothetical protein NDU88_002709 [Pleurodeles waltl]|uniref:Uncharacterized protein n=1 Tax=Pleurodeles waltl TaxID=8319 RepID=A0AAV7KW73_PLEWA|nr:hypothetical protein NDU88_002709 [Pleurodeles waltl]